MIANANFVLREIVDENILLPTGEESNRVHGVVRLNGTGAFLWKALASEQSIESLVDAMVAAYDVSEEIALHDVKAFIDLMNEHGCICQ